MRTRTLFLSAVSGLAVTIAAAACSSGGGNGTSNAVRCQINWLVQASTGGPNSHNIYLVDAPESVWAGATHTVPFTRAVGSEVLGAFYKDFVKSSNGNITWANRAIASNGQGAFSSAITATTTLAATSGMAVSFSDSGGHILFDLPGSNVIGSQDGSGGTASFTGVWSSLTNTVPGTGLATATFLGTSITLNQIAYGVCYPASAAAVSKYEVSADPLMQRAEEVLGASIDRR